MLFMVVFAHLIADRIRECSAGRYMQHITAFIVTIRALCEIPAEIPAVGL